MSVSQAELPMSGAYAAVRLRIAVITARAPLHVSTALLSGFTGWFPDGRRDHFLPRRTRESRFESMLGSRLRFCSNPERRFCSQDVSIHFARIPTFRRFLQVVPSLSLERRLRGTARLTPQR